MCKCTPNIRTPFCGKPGCEWPAQTSETSSQEQAILGRAASMRADLRSFIRDARVNNERGSALNCRPLSEAITCAETAYLWLCQLPGGDKALEF
jgi:hypothetical protein